jgi:hypothetical protein
MAVVIRVKRGTTTQWNNSTTPLSPGELGYDLTSKVIKIGDGTTLWNNLNPLNKFEIDEISQDAIYSALTNFVSTGENITVEYNDAENFIRLDTGPDVVLVSDLATAITEANEYTDLAVAGLGNSIDGQYVPTSAVGNLNGVAPLDADSLIPDQYIPAGIARDSEIVTSYNDLTDKPAIALGAVKWTANHYQLEGGENTRYLAGDIVWDGGNIYVANFDNESLPTTNTQYWSLVGPGNRLNIDGRDIPNILWDNIGNKPTLFDGSYNSLTNLPTLFSGSYADLTDKPSLFDGDYASLTNLPILFSGSYNDLTDKPTIPDLTGYATETYVNTAVSNLVDTAPETLNTLNELAAAINDDASFASTVTTSLGNKLDSSTAATTYAPISSPTFTGTVSGITASMVGLGSVDNTSDANKPVSTATQTALDLKLNISEPSIDYYITNSGSGAYLVNGISNGTIYFEKGKKYRIYVNANGHPFWIQTVSGGYSSANVYNSGIANNGTQNGHIIIELPQNAPQLYYACQYHSSMAGSIFVGSRSTTSKAIADLSNVDNTSDLNKPISTATQTALDLKSDEKISYISESGTSRTISASDLYKVIHTSSGSAVTITIPDDTGDLLFPIGSYLEIRQMGAGQVTVSTTSPATAVAPDNAFKTRVQYSSIVIEKHQANSWYVTGDTTA